MKFLQFTGMSSDLEFIGLDEYEQELVIDETEERRYRFRFCNVLIPHTMIRYIYFFLYLLIQN